jgi:serine/threonine protein kinase
MGLPFGFGIDMWSVGCILVEVYTGMPLFVANSREKLLAQMISMLGPLPQHPYCNSKHYTKYFDKYHNLKIPLHSEELGNR